MKIFYHFIMDPRRGGPHQFVKNFINVSNKKIKNHLVINGKNDKKINLYFFRNFGRYLYFFEIIINFFKIYYYFKINRQNKKPVINIHGFYNVAPLLFSIFFNGNVNWFIHEEISKGKQFFLKLIPKKINLFFLYHYSSIGIKKRKNYFIIKPSIDTTYWKSSLKKFSKNSLISVGNLNPTKNHLLLLKAILTINEPLELKIAGGKLKSHKEYYKKILKFKNRLNKSSIKKIVLLGKISNDLIKKNLVSSEYFVMTSHSEGTPFALLEAMSCKKICVIPRINTLKKTLKNQYSGFYFAKNDVNSLKSTLLKIISLTDKEKNLIGMNSRKIILKEYSKDIFKKNIYKYFIKNYE